MSAPDDNVKASSVSRRKFIKYGIAGAIGVGIASAVEIPILGSQINNDNEQINSLKNQVQTLQNQLSSDVQQQDGIVTLSMNEVKELEAMVETIIPSDQNGPGAKEAGVIFFIDRQLATDYGTNARMYMKGPFIQQGIKGPLTVENITYSAGSQAVPWQAGMQYQYNLPLREFWRYGLEATQTYSNKAKGKNFEDLSSADQIQILNDLDDNKPTDFNGIVPHDFFQELIFMTWSGFFMDPVYGGNKGMVGWSYTGFTGANMGDAFNENRNVLQLMVADKPTKYPPHSMGEFLKTLKIIGGS